jgi:hypothetical protein
MDSGFDLFNEIMRQRHNNQIFSWIHWFIVKKKKIRREERYFYLFFLVEFVEVEYD